MNKQEFVMAERKPFQEQSSPEIDYPDAEYAAPVQEVDDQCHGHTSTVCEEQSRIVGPSDSYHQLVTPTKSKLKSKGIPRDIPNINSKSTTRKFSSKELNKTIDNKNSQWNDTITIQVKEKTDAIKVNISLERNLNESGEKMSALDINAEVDSLFYKELQEQERKCAIRLEAELRDVYAGRELEVIEPLDHEFRDNQINFTQYLALERDIKSCSSGLAHLDLKAKFCHYPKSLRV